MSGANDPSLRVIDSTDDMLSPLPPAGAGAPSSEPEPGVTIPPWCAAFLLGLVNRCGLPLETPGLIESFTVLRDALARVPGAPGGRRVRPQ